MLHLTGLAVEHKASPEVFDRKVDAVVAAAERLSWLFKSLEGRGRASILVSCRQPPWDTEVAESVADRVVRRLWPMILQRLDPYKIMMHGTRRTLAMLLRCKDPEHGPWRSVPCDEMQLIELYHGTITTLSSGPGSPHSADRTVGDCITPLFKGQSLLDMRTWTHIALNEGNFCRADVRPYTLPPGLMRHPLWPDYDQYFTLRKWLFPCCCGPHPGEFHSACCSKHLQHLQKATLTIIRPTTRSLLDRPIPKWLFVPRVDIKLHFEPGDANVEEGAPGRSLSTKLAYEELLRVIGRHCSHHSWRLQHLYLDDFKGVLMRSNVADSYRKWVAETFPGGEPKYLNVKDACPHFFVMERVAGRPDTKVFVWGKVFEGLVIE